MTISKFLRCLIAIAIKDYRQARSDWNFARRQMDQLQSPSLYKEDD